MANITGQVTVDQLSILEVDGDPSVSGGTVAAIGSVALYNNGTIGQAFLKTGAGATAWELQTTASLFATAVLGRSSLSTVGAVPFVSTAGVLTQDSNFNWNNSTKKLIVGPAGTTLANNYLSMNGNINSFIQTSVQNLNAGTTASSDFVATADNGDDSSGYVNLGINSSANSDPTYTVAGAKDAYLAVNGSNLVIGTQGATDLAFFTGGTLVANKRMSIVSGGQVLIGTVAPIDITGAGTLPIFQIASTAVAQMATIAYSNDSTPPVQNMLKSRGTTVGVQGLLSADDELGRLQFRGSDGSNFQAGASIRAAVDGSPAANSMPGRLILMTTPSGSTTPVERIRIDQSGNVGIGNISPTYQLDINGEIRVRGGTPDRGTVLESLDTTGYARWTDRNDLNDQLHFSDDFLADINSGVLAGQSWTIVANAGTVTSNTGNIDNLHPGVVYLSTGANATSNPTIYMSASAMTIGNTYTVIQMLIQTPNATPTAAQNFVMRIGLGDNVGATTADFVDGIYFEFPVSGTTAIQCKTSASSARTTVSSSVNWTLSTWYLLEAKITSSSVVYFINGNQVATISTNIPTAVGQTMGPIFRISKTAGTAARILTVDAYRISRYYNVNRY